MHIILYKDNNFCLYYETFLRDIFFVRAEKHFFFVEMGSGWLVDKNAKNFFEKMKSFFKKLFIFLYSLLEQS